MVTMLRPGYADGDGGPLRPATVTVAGERTPDGTGDRFDEGEESN
jgi:hypothetical protein